jgi:hypothetical protein
MGNGDFDHKIQVSVPAQLVNENGRAMEAPVLDIEATGPDLAEEDFFAPAEQAEELIKQHERECLEASSAMVAERKNYPNASRLRPWGLDTFIGKIIPNELTKTASGRLFIPDTHECQDVPSACEIMAVSEQVTKTPLTVIEWVKSQVYPYLPAWLAKRLPEVRYRRLYPQLQVGTFVFITLGAGDRWPGYDGCEYVMANGRNVRGDYSKFWTDEQEQTWTAAPENRATSAIEEAI